MNWVMGTRPQCNGKSQRLEPYAFPNVLDMIIDGVIVASITTDRHKQIKKVLREKYQHILHQFDVWNFSKNVKKHFCKTAQLKRREILWPWIKSIINHIWWSCTTCEGKGQLIREKWTGI